MNKDYEINEGTLAIEAIDSENSRVYEDNMNYVVGHSTFDIMEHSCRYFGSSYEGRRQGSKEIIGANYKLPIVVEDGRNLVFFPTLTADDKDCMWIAVNKIKDYEPGDFNTTKITFYNNVTLTVPISYRSFQNQIFRASRLSYIVQNRKKN